MTDTLRAHALAAISEATNTKAYAGYKNPSPARVDRVAGQLAVVAEPCGECRTMHEHVRVVDADGRVRERMGRPMTVLELLHEMHYYRRL